jgi:hypothetical protein
VAASSSSPQKEAREYINQKGTAINIGRVNYEHVAGIVALLKQAEAEGKSSEVINELAKTAQEAHNQVDEIRAGLYKVGGDQKLSEATLTLQEGANELKNAMGALVAYTGSPNPATLAHFSTQLEAAKTKWNEGAEAVWALAKESGAMTLR